MAMSVRSGTPSMCASMALQEQRECVQTSSGGEIESSCPNPNGIGTEDRNDVRGDNVAEPVVGVRVVSDRSGS